jgi:hypothetical protein
MKHGCTLCCHVCERTAWPCARTGGGQHSRYSTGVTVTNLQRIFEFVIDVGDGSLCQALTALCWRPPLSHAASTGGARAPST